MGIKKGLTHTPEEMEELKEITLNEKFTKGDVIYIEKNNNDYISASGKILNFEIENWKIKTYGNFYFLENIQKLCQDLKILQKDIFSKQCENIQVDVSDLINLYLLFSSNNLKADLDLYPCIFDFLKY